MKINYWSDIACPYCYIGETNMKKALEVLALEPSPDLRLRSYELNPEAPLMPHGNTQGRLEKKYNLTSEQSAEKIAKIDLAGKAAGLDMDYANAVYTNTRRAHRLVKLAQSKGDPKLADAIAEDLYRAYFTEHLELSDPEVLVSIGEKNGLGREEIQTMLDGDAFLAEVLEDENEARALGITGVPFFLINDKYAFSGALSVQQMSVILNKILEDGVPGDRSKEPA